MDILNHQDIRDILQKRFEGDFFYSLKDLPHPHTLKDSKLGAEMVKEAICQNQEILIVGDYDVDGILSVVIMMSFFDAIGYKNIRYHIPNRFSDGYGIKVHLIKQLVASNFNGIIITVDNGISAFEVGEYCRENNIRLIITDHHMPQEKLPLANAIINPQQPNCNFQQKSICGASIAWYFCNSIKIALDLKISMLDLLKYVAIATIADMMPLTHVNKILVKKGIEVFRNSTKKPDLLLKTLFKTPKFDSQDISFNLTPLLNSAGRLGDAKVVVDFFLSKKEEETHFIFNQLKNINQQRKNLVEEILMESKNFIKENKYCIIAYKEDWNEGVLGIIATKLAEQYNKPAFAFKIENSILKGSGRSDGKIDIFQTLLIQKELFLHFGGHSQAIGLSLSYENLDAFLDIFKNAKPLLQEEKHNILGKINLDMIDQKLLQILEEFQPYGQANPYPHFVLENVTILESKPIKQVHQKLLFRNQIEGMIFFSNEFYNKNDKVNLCVTLQESLYSKTPTLIIKEISKCPS
ncbi:MULTISPECIES: single-stranded-DNA-specific exonuclease RecJ [unclassified Helicobacter]|uniref:single-stranded-DNA-specific exonuclease RecJ n=1 Tax=unclassified Helicobacter TaxID=2593540 RepID=UPI000CF0BE28|nr:MULTISPECIES: single-stranded-DNA-specific exonuclease RecJ [unclassified Helicobacter]